ncbi:MAG TPA: hypothetical protein VIS74_03635 [Chthoniobacterales bacterium]
MNTYEITYQQLKERFEKSGQDVQGFLAPLIALSDDSSSLIVGYGSDQTSIREDLIPYFHLVGRRIEGQEPLRALAVGSWVGTEPASSLAVARLVAALETRLSLAHDMEVTAYPVLNIEAYREGAFLTGKQQLEGVHVWQDSKCSHVVVIERELQRYAYDLILNFRVNPHSADLTVEGWAESEVRGQIFSDPLARFAEVSPAFHWELNPKKGSFSRIFTPLPGRFEQPVEVAVGLPGMLSADEQAAAGLRIALSLLHQFRQARMEGML